MSDQLKAEISVNVGEVPNSPGLKVAAKLGLGFENSGAIRNCFRGKSNQDLEDASLFIVVSARNAESAESLRNTIQTVIDKSKTEEGRENLPSPLNKLVAASEDEQCEGPRFVFSVTTHESNVVVKARPVNEAREQWIAMYETGVGIAGEAISREQEVYFEFDIGKSVEEIVNSNNAVLDIFEALSLKIWLHLHPQIFADLVNVGSNLGAPEQIVMALGSVGLFTSAVFNLNFKSATELPDEIKSFLERVSAKGNDIKTARQEIPEGVKRFFKHFAENGTGNLSLYAGVQTSAVCIDLHLPGLSKFLSE